MGNGVFFFHGCFAECLVEFAAEKDRVVAKTVGASIFVDDFAVRSAAAAYVTSVRLTEYDTALKVCSSVDRGAVLFKSVELGEEFFVVVLIVARLAGITGGVYIGLSVKRKYAN